MKTIVKVTEQKYLPEKCKLRVWISDFIFTADINDEDLEVVMSDPKVMSIEKSKSIRSKN
jgi:hypothetical protein